MFEEKEKFRIPTLIEMEVAVSNLYDVRKYIIVPNISWGLGVHECDLLILNQNNNAIEVEIKRSKADLKKDIDKKHLHKSKLIKYLYFAIPEQLIESVNLIPDHAGIIIVTGFRYKPNFKLGYKATISRKAKINPEHRSLSVAEVLNFSRLGCMRIWNLKKKIISLQNQT